MTHPGFSKKGGGTIGGLGVKPPATGARGVNEFYGFNIKNTHFSHFFIEKEHAVSAVTMDNAKTFSQLMSKAEVKGGCNHY